MALLEYPVTRPIHLRRIWKTILVVGAIVWITAITLINVVAVGYELAPFTSTSYNSSATLWYEEFMPSSSWFPKSRNCQWSVIRLMDFVRTDIRGFFTYVFYAYLDPREDSTVDGMQYEGDPLVNCSISSIEFIQPLTDPFKVEVYIQCNTTADQNFMVHTGYDVQASEGAPLTAAQLISNTYPLALSTEPLNITDALALWAAITQATLDMIAPANSMSLLLPSAQSNGLSSLHFLYMDAIQTNASETPQFIPNIIGGEYWTLWLEFTYEQDVESNLLGISFLPTGEIDLAHTSQTDLDMADSILAPTLEYMFTVTQTTTFDLWKFINFVFVSYHYVFLSDFGQIYTTSYLSTPGGLPDFSQPGFQIPASNNIFVNETLFDLYNTYLRTTILPFFQLYIPNFKIPDFLPINETNSLQEIDTTFLRSYDCTQRQLRGGGSVFISVLVADYALIGGPYTFFIFIAGWLYRRRERSEFIYGQTNNQGNLVYASQPRGEDGCKGNGDDSDEQIGSFSNSSSGEKV